MNPRIQAALLRVGVPVLAVAAVAATGTALFLDRSLVRLRVEQGQAQALVARLRTQAMSDARRLSQAQEQARTARTQSASEQDQLRASVEAFAKQAASCEDVKKRLHLTEDAGGRVRVSVN